MISPGSALRGAVGVGLLLVAVSGAFPPIRYSDAPITRPGSVTSAPQYAPCTEEDGSTPGQSFPCSWDASKRGNGIGRSYVLIGPICSEQEAARAAELHTMGQDIVLPCDDRESQMIG